MGNKTPNTIIAGSEHCEHTRVSAGLVQLTLIEVPIFDATLN